MESEEIFPEAKKSIKIQENETIPGEVFENTPEKAPIEPGTIFDPESGKLRIITPEQWDSKLITTYTFVPTEIPQTPPKVARAPTAVAAPPDNAPF